MKTATSKFTLIALGSLAALAACAQSTEPAATPLAQVAGTVAAQEAASATPIAAAAGATAASTYTPDPALPSVLVHKNANCGCCVLWVEHMRKSGFQVEVRDSEDLEPLKNSLGVPPEKRSCHTAEVAGYFIEGHVPAEDVRNFLARKPEAKGLVVAGMPMGSPGMEVPDGRTQPYTVELVAKDGTSSAFAEH